MAEYIERKALIKQIDNYFDQTDPSGEEQIGVLQCRRIAREFPAADVVPVVRCRDCKHNPGYKAKGKDKVWCRKWRNYTLLNGFCISGERRSE